jgi:PAS domain S-box-containing protein
MMTRPSLLLKPSENMREIVCVNLENDMDLILAHKRAMKLCELTGFTLIAQTSVATAISEVARCAIEHGKSAELKLGIDLQGGKKSLVALIRDKADFSRRCSEAIQYAKRLVDDIEVGAVGKEFQIVLKQQLNFAHTITEGKLNSFVDYFRQEPPISPYDEIRRKNLLLQELAEKLQESESDFRILTDSLPLMMFSVNSRGNITYTNQWLKDFLGGFPREVGAINWQKFLHPTDFTMFSKDLTNALTRQTPLNGQYRFVEKSRGDGVWHIFSIIPLKNEKNIILRWIGFIVDVHAHKQVEQTLKDNQDLKETQDRLFENQAQLQQKIIELNRSNYELEQFAHLASHDLQEPLRKLFFYSDVMKQRYSENIDQQGRSMLNNMTVAAGRMKELINDLLSYSQLQQQQLRFETVDLNQVIQEIIRDLDLTIREKNARIETDELPVLQGNKIRLRQLFSNLISNALKYSKKNITPVIEITSSVEPGAISIKIKDNGIGFDAQHREKIFGLFERLHSRDEFPGTGIGLSICKKIAELHNGTISAMSEPGEYSVFEVTLPIQQQTESIKS